MSYDNKLKDQISFLEIDNISSSLLAENQQM